ncbi:MAG TPA: FMN-binding protein [Clostridia bacterium]
MKKKHVILLVVFVAIAGIVLAAVIVMSSLEKNLKLLANLPVADVDVTKLADGKYSGSFSAFPVSAEVIVTIANRKIADIDLVKHVTGQGQAAEILPEKVVEAQSLDVDSVSGASYSSKVILKAIEDALASGDIR